MFWRAGGLWAWQPNGLVSTDAGWQQAALAWAIPNFTAQQFSGGAILFMIRWRLPGLLNTLGDVTLARQCYPQNLPGQTGLHPHPAGRRPWPPSAASHIVGWPAQTPTYSGKWGLGAVIGLTRNFSTQKPCGGPRLSAIVLGLCGKFGRGAAGTIPVPVMGRHSMPAVSVLLRWCGHEAR